jgi:2',3'-cyclic-nucleotide 2'-phosphodiesterase (5'-nucleotidase family)
VTLGGVARIGGLFDGVRAECPDRVITLDNGDTFHGTHVAVTSKGHALVPMMNALKFDAMTVHWEFAYGPEGMRAIADALDHPVLAINIHRKTDDALYFAPFRMIERNGLRVAIIGLACPIVDKTMPPSFSTGLYFTTGDRDLPRWIDHVRNEEGADLVVILSHLGFPQDVKLAEEISGIDILLSGHTHNRMEEAIIVNRAIVFQSGCHGSFIGRLDVEVEQRKVVAHRHRLIPVGETIAERADLTAMINDALAPERAAMDSVVGRIEVPLHRYAMLSAPMDDLLLSAIAESAGTQIAFSNGWRYGAPVAPGPITLRDLWNMIPVNPPVSVIDLTGAEIREMLEANLERTFASDPYRQMGGFIKRMRGIRMYFKAENPPGHRIDQLFVEGRPVDPAATYRAAFVTSQGVPGAFGRNRRNLEVHAIDALRTRLLRPWSAEDSEESVFEV